MLVNVPMLPAEVPVFSFNFNSIKGESPDDAALTVTTEVPVTDVLLTEVAVIVADPTATAVTNPLLSTVAIAVLLDDQVTF